MGIALSEQLVVQVGLLLVVTIPLRFAIRHRTRMKLALDAFVFAVLSALFVFHGIEPYVPGRPGDLSTGIAVGAAKGAWWISLSLLLVNVIRNFIVFENRPREGRLLRDLVSGLVYIGMALSLIAYVFDVPVGTLIVTSGVFAIVLGLALQSTLNDVFSGIALNLGRPYLVGDWIVLDDNLQGRVIETNWRATHLLSPTNDVVILPNSTLAKARLTNFSSPDESHGITVSTRFLPTVRPEVILEAMRTAMLGCTKILRSPPPNVSITELSGDGVGVELACRVRDVNKVSDAKNEIYDLVFRHARSWNLALSIVGKGQFATEVSIAGHDGPMGCILSIPLFQTLEADERFSLSQSMALIQFARGSVIAAQGTALTSLILIERGVAVVEATDDGTVREITRLSPGDVFGERGVLLGMLEPGDVRALTPVRAYEIPKDKLAAFLKERPTIAEELGAILSHRLERERHLHDDLERHALGNAVSFSARIRTLFALR
jgi:small-conductance mechanosensitive channel/CRP-like cAMP-binding protein